MSAAAVNGAPGWFGKLPGAGDFVSRRLPDAFVQPWDEWLQRGLAHARASLGSGWLDGYLVAPIVRFWVGPGVLGAAAWGGVVMPSVDRVGRHFPLTIAQGSDGLDGALAARQWYAAIDTIARCVLDVDATIDDFERALEAAAPRTAEPSAAESRLARELLPRAARQSSIWWCDGAQAASAFHRFDGLPPAAAFVTALGAAVR